MSVIHWTEIESFHNIRKFMKAYPENLRGNNTVAYKSKVKLHGSNCAVQVHTYKSIVTQSRTSILTTTDDYAGFSKWIGERGSWKPAEGHVIFGEWCGPGIQKSVAISDIPKKIFAVFAARLLDDSSKLIVEPAELANLVGHISGVYVLPWHQEASLEVDWTASDEELTKKVDLINEWVSAVEKNDPWVDATFGVKGTGEGLVFYPSSPEHLGLENYNNLVFKAKGEKHRVIKVAAPAQVSAESAANVGQFVNMVLTEARLNQGVEAVATRDDSSLYDMKKIGKFLAWVVADVQKETKDELEASHLEWKQVQKPLSDKARSWYLTQSKK